MKSSAQGQPCGETGTLYPVLPPHQHSDGGREP